ncbi:MAG: GNAT family N-acetyltransferase [Methanomassiliicoccales archaeon]|nr:GNAT family N-acetyltransferase [Methanomassiliicoccales archaeon]
MAKVLSDIIVRPMANADLATVQEVGATAWSDIASRELGRKVNYPVRPRRIIEAYMWKEPQGCLVAERRDRIVGVAYSHVWGEVGWLGPFEVLPDTQDQGIGTALLARCDDYLESRGCKVQGLETMSNHAKNVHFYMRAGYRIIGSSLIMERQLNSKVEEDPREVPSTSQEVLSALAEISSLSRKGNPLVDYSREVEMAAMHDLGPVFLLRVKSKLEAIAVLHSYFPPTISDHVSVRIMLVNPRLRAQDEAFARLMASCEAWAFQHGRRRAFVRFPADNLFLYRKFLACGYKLAAANLRLARGSPYKEKGKYHLAAWAG